MFSGTSRSWKLNVSVSSRSREFGKIECLGLVSVLRVQRLGLRSRDFTSCQHPCNAPGLRIYQEENNGSDLQETGRQVTRLHQLVFSNCNTAVSGLFGTSRLVLESLGKWNVSVSSRSYDLTSCGHPWRSVLMERIANGHSFNTVHMEGIGDAL